MPSPPHPQQLSLVEASNAVSPALPLRGLARVGDGRHWRRDSSISVADAEEVAHQIAKNPQNPRRLIRLQEITAELLNHASGRPIFASEQKVRDLIDADQIDVAPLPGSDGRVAISFKSVVAKNGLKNRKKDIRGEIANVQDLDPGYVFGVVFVVVRQGCKDRVVFDISESDAWEIYKKANQMIEAWKAAGAVTAAAVLQLDLFKPQLGFRTVGSTLKEMTEELWRTHQAIALTTSSRER